MTSPYDSGSPSGGRRAHVGKGVARATGSNNPRLQAQRQQAAAQPGGVARGQRAVRGAGGPNAAQAGQRSRTGYASGPAYSQAGYVPAAAGGGYGAGGTYPPGQIPHMPVKKKMQTWKKVLLGILGGILVIALGVGIAAGAYYNNLKSNIGFDGDLSALKGILTEADYQKPFYVLVIGSDHWEDYGARSDAMILARVDLNKPQITMVSIPRDTPYQIDGQKVKLNEVFSREGEIACVEAVSNLTGVDISHYVELEFDQLQSVVDSLGGVMVDVPYTFDYQVYTLDEPVVHVDAGKQLLTGEQAIALARMRTAYEAGVSEDAIRQANIRAMMVGVMKQVLSQPIPSIPGEIEKLSGMIQTDIPLDDLVSWATKMAQADEVVLYSCTGPTEGGIDEETQLWLTDEAPQKWAELMKAVDAGQDPSGIVDVSQSADGKVQLEGTEVL
ncbi:LCP family protein [Adlercreutzia sp. ZJ242]|uniref:LCP family protein n=1 Tax=Adlercreutzia sp. ZJ242 TaxID=2709409 RepID=UPI0013ED664F|nr:LCP family protein [Adlercreutzia sp. ZJ242]